MRRLTLGVTVVATLLAPGQTALATARAPVPATRTSGAPAAGSGDLASDPASLVNPFIGTTNDGDTFPGADAPFGMVQWSPDTTSMPDGGGYSYHDSAITGFSLTHISGPGCRAAGDIPVLPTVGAVSAKPTDKFAHARETASPGYYKVALQNGITTQLTATTRTGMAQFTFPASAQANLIFKLAGSQTGDSATSFTAVSGTEVAGSVTSGHFCTQGNSYTVYFDMQFSQQFTGSGATTGGTGPTSAYLTFNTDSDQTLLAKVGISYLSTANARANLAAENPGWDFDTISGATTAAWNALLDRVQIAGGTAAQRTVFYTALYHSLLNPNVFSDDNGQYRGVDGKVHTVDPGHSAFYTNFSGWDIYRAQAQLEALIDSAAASDTAQSMVDDYAQDGMLPKWLENNGESYIMVGDPAAPILADYYAFGARNFNAAAALTGMVAEATNPGNIRPGLSYLIKLGFLPDNGSYGCCFYHYPVATTLEYDTADFAVSALAGDLGDTTEQHAFANQAQDWRNVLDPASGFDQRRDLKKRWTGGFTPTDTAGFAESDSWVYTGMVPFDLAGLTKAKGGDGPMTAYLQTVLRSDTGANGYAFVGNEPSTELPWEYDYVGKPYLTQAKVRQIQDKIWTDTPNGLGDGNDDLGALSAWYVWSALGMYPMTPGTTNLALGSPLFRDAVLTLPSGNTFTIIGNGAATGSPYVQSVSWNGTSWRNAYAPARAIAGGGTLSFTLGAKPNTSLATRPGAAPPSYPGSVAAPKSPRVGAVTSVTRRCLDDRDSRTAKGNPVQVAHCNASAAQEWTIAGDGTVRALGNCLAAASGKPGAAVGLYTCDSTPGQRWTIGSDGALANRGSRLCLSDSGASSRPGTQVRLETCRADRAQRWKPPAKPAG